MIVQELVGDVTSPTVGIIGHGVNCQGVMGSGVAKAIREKFPQAYTEYKKLCDRTKPESLLGVTQLVQITDDLYVANMFTQLNYGADGKQYASIVAIREAISSLRYQREDLLKKRYQGTIDQAVEALDTVLDSWGVMLNTDGACARGKVIRSELENIIATLNNAYEDDGVTTEYALPVHLPLIGCGLGGLEWNHVRDVIDTKHGGPLPVTIYHYQTPNA